MNGGAGKTRTGERELRERGCQSHRQFEPVEKSVLAQTQRAGEQAVMCWGFSKILSAAETHRTYEYDDGGAIIGRI